MSKKNTPDTSHTRPASNGAGELDERIWAVVSFEKCEATGLSYHEAMARIADLERGGTYGLCIVTAVAAERIGRRPSPRE